MLMGGDISMTSEYGKGSSFTVTIPQGIDTPEPFAAVDNPEDKKVLVYEGRVIYAQSVCWSLENMGVPYTMATTLEEFTDALFKEEWTMVLSGYGLHERIKNVMEKPGAVYVGGKKPPLALMVEWGTEAYIPNVRFVSLPVQSLSIANVLNGKADSKSYADNVGLSGIIRYTFPRARLLVVDDIPTNLKVAEGLLTPYKAMVDCCLNGVEAIERVKHDKYDIVFMDHMMPDMDGIETTMHIREWEASLGKDASEKVPIIALTANAVSGVRDMFVSKGFNDFLAKPIDISKLDDMLIRWISKEKRDRGKKHMTEEEESAQSLHIEGVDITKGIALTGGTEAGYRSVLSMFRRDVEERLTQLQKEPDTEGLQDFVINVHALKSASASIGASETSAKAAALEAAGNEGDIEFIKKNLGDFTKNLRELLDNISAAVGIPTADEDAHFDISVYIPILRELEEALKSEKAESIDRIMGELSQKPMDAKTKEALDKISDEVLMTEFDAAVEEVGKLING
jgi:CheY-like chemotaxis protein